jgi:hypothetical protein
MIFLARYLVSGYLLYALQDYVGATLLPAANAEIAARLFNIIQTVVSMRQVSTRSECLRRGISPHARAGSAWSGTSPRLRARGGSGQCSHRVSMRAAAAFT